MSRGPILTDKTTLAELQKLGATTLSDIPMVELLEFIRYGCLQVSSDTILDKEDEEMCEAHALAATYVQGAIDVLNDWIKDANLED